ncbi:uncharacterized protein LOC111383734, partial [Olea europaea var. sylvestris]|uniref:uncharacterized protein LOC111383734 n=1 Tax=Olea europaea var. sylvestris TaxID=158386 RepID=UPI000C1D0240
VKLIFCGAGGIIRNERGDIVIAFAEELGEGTNNGAELLALLYGLRHAKRMGINCLEVKIDSLIIVNWLRRKVCDIWYLEDYREEIQYLLSIISCRIQHIYRDGNSIADILSKLERLVFHISGWTLSQSHHQLEELC